MLQSDRMSNGEPADIRQISWVTPSKFDAEKISIQPVTSGDSYERFKILYQYSDSPC